MSPTIPEIVKHLPNHRERILRARFQTRVVDELCRDYEIVAAGLESDPSEIDREELLRLARDLEEEMLDWLAAHQEADSHD